MPAPDYDKMESYKPYSEASGEKTDDMSGSMSDTLMMLADKLGFDETKAQALHDFIKECLSEDSYSEDSDEDGE